MQDELRCEELTLGNRDTDFATRYMAAAAIHERMRRQPELASRHTLFTLETALLDPSILGQRQALNLCREAAGALSAVYIASPDESTAAGAMAVLRGAMPRTYGAGHQAVTTALGSLPIPVKAPPKPDVKASRIEKVRFSDLVAASGKKPVGPVMAAGRSLIAPLADSDRLLVVKLARAGDDPCGLWREADWLAGLDKILEDCPADCHIPHPIAINGTCAFQVEELPETNSIGLPRQKQAIAFIARQDYFQYPNGDGQGQVLQPEHCREVLQRGAKLLGWFAARGILHTAPIPLFHNRVQGARRDDLGLYDWQLGGRLDQWLSSCLHPNFGASGLRDFEHLEIISGPGPPLHWHLGMHFFSLLLVAGSCFRYREPETVGLDRQGLPVDARHFFQADELQKLIETIFSGYHEGFVGSRDTPPVPVCTERLASRMIEEMGVDAHMEELLRVRDQRDMTEGQFRDFLVSRGYTTAEARRVKRGAADLVLHTGPHLGGFNDRISLPELIDASAAMAAHCVLDRYRGTRDSSH